MKHRLHLRLYGGVQGVGFRWFTAEAARRLDLAGWVANRADGSVELEGEGPAERVAEFRAIVSRGPPHATVRRVEELAAGADPLPAPFEIRRGGG